jgi:hypothetical protein
MIASISVWSVSLSLQQDVNSSQKKQAQVVGMFVFRSATGDSFHIICVNRRQQLFVKIILWFLLTLLKLPIFQTAFDDFTARVFVQVALYLLHQEVEPFYPGFHHLAEQGSECA